MWLEVDLSGSQTIIDAAVGLLTDVGIMPYLTGMLGAMIILGAVTAVIKWVRS